MWQAQTYLLTLQVTGWCPFRTRETKPTLTLQTLSSRQLLAPANLQLRRRSYADSDSECEPSTSTGCQSSEKRDAEARESSSVSSQPLSSSNRKRKTRDVDETPRQCLPPPPSPILPRRWVKRDLNSHHNEWISPPLRSVPTISEASEPVEFFELFFSHEVIMHIASFCCLCR